MSFHSGVLPPQQQEALRELGRAAADAGFYLAGGTAVAVQLGESADGSGGMNGDSR